MSYDYPTERVTRTEEYDQRCFETFTAPTCTTVYFSLETTPTTVSCCSQLHKFAVTVI